MYTSGFPASLDYVVDEAKIKSRDAPGGYAWVLDMATTDHGQSGSPVYDETGRVVGVIKGDLRGANQGQIIGTVFIPIERAEALLLPARFDELRKLALSPPRCRVCFKQAVLTGCLGAQRACSDWSDANSGTAATTPGSPKPTRAGPTA